MPSLRTRDALNLHLHEWRSSRPERTLMLLHGYAEHGARYEAVARTLNDHGINLFAVDLRGHGRSSGQRGGLVRFRDYFRDAEVLLDHIRSQGEKEPVDLMGHSMGGLIACDWLLSKRAKGLSRLILSSPLFELGEATAVKPARARTATFASWIVPFYREKLSFDASDLTSDPAIIEAHQKDSLILKDATARWYVEAVKAMRRVRAGVATLSLPIYMFYGDADRVVSPDALRRVGETLPVGTSRVMSYEGLRHETLNERPEARARVLNDLVEFLTGQDASPPS